MPYQRYDASSELSDPARLFKRMATDVKQSLELTRALYVRNIKSQFRQSILGYAWLFFPPVATTLVWYMLNRSGVVKVAETNIPYPIFVMIGTLLWQAFMDCITKPLSMLKLNKAMMVKLNFPREALILAGIGETVTVSTVRLLLLIPIFLFMSISPDATIALFPLAYCVLLILGISIGLLLAPIGLLFDDIARAISLIGQFLIYTAPVVYPIATHGLLKWVNIINPITYPLNTARAWLTGQSGTPEIMLVVGLCATVLLLLAWCIFHITLPRIVERLGM